jgi:hypothetical protein
MKQPDFHVAVTGKDSNPGTAAKPFASLTRARDAVRERIKAGLTKDILVKIGGGTYPVTERVTFGPEDSGTERFAITYAAAPGEKVVLSGGQQITGWQKGQGEVWTTEIPAVKAGKWYFRQLFIHGVRATRARTPNIRLRNGWWTIKSASHSRDKAAPPDVPVVLSPSGKIADYTNPTDIEFVHICNNDMGRKRVAAISAVDQTITLSTPNRWNSRAFKFDWYLSIPTAGQGGQQANLCYLENAREMLDEPGEWYLDRQTGQLSYWPRPGEKMEDAVVIAPVAQSTLLAFVGTPDRVVRNVHVRGIRCEYVDWTPPAWGYMGLFCCNVQVDREPNPGHRFIDAAVEYSHARLCSFRDGGVAHAGAMGICLRDGTGAITIEGNEIGDLGAGGIGFGGCNVAAGYLDAAPPPQADDYKGYRIANNHIHHCGADYYGAVGIAQFLVQESVVANNLIHDTAYFGMGVAGSQNPKVPFVKDNLIEKNRIYNTMKITVDGAGMYVAMGHYGRGTLIRENAIHDVVNAGPCGGLYLDTNNHGCHYEDNVVYGVPGVPFIVNFSEASKNTWRDNVIQKGAPLPKELIEALQALTGLEPAYRQSLLGEKVAPWVRHAMEGATNTPCGVTQFDLPTEGRGVIQFAVRGAGKEPAPTAKLQGLDGKATYRLRCHATPPGGGEAAPADSAALGLPATIAGSDLLEKGLTANLGDKPRFVWVVYEKTK